MLEVSVADWITLELSWYIAGCQTYGPFSVPKTIRPLYVRYPHKGP